MIRLVILLAVFLQLGGPSWAQKDPPPPEGPQLLLQLMVPSPVSIEERLDLYDDALTGECAADDRGWTSSEARDRTARIQNMLDQGMLPEGTSLTVTHWTATGCDMADRTYMTEAIELPGIDLMVSQIGLQGATHVEPGYLSDYLSQLAMAGGIFARQAGCGNQSDTSWLLVTGSRYIGEIEIDHYLQERGSPPQAEVTSAWEESWTIRYCEGQEHSLNVLVGHDVLDGVGIVMQIPGE